MTSTTNTPNSPDFLAIADEAQVELLAAQTLEAAELSPDDAGDAFERAEIGYYEASLISLRNAATTMYEAEHPPE